MFTEDSVPEEDKLDEPSPAIRGVCPAQISSASLISGILSEITLPFQSLHLHQLKGESVVQKVSLLENKQEVPGFVLKKMAFYTLWLGEVRVFALSCPLPWWMLFSITSTIPYWRPPWRIQDSAQDQTVF